MLTGFFLVFVLYGQPVKVPQGFFYTEPACREWFEAYRRTLSINFSYKCERVT